MTVETLSLQEKVPLLRNCDIVVPRMSKRNMAVKASLEPIGIRVTQHPLNTFYKDEGGKSNHLVCAVVVTLGKGSDKKRQKRNLPLGGVRVIPKLVYENGKPVEDADEIFTVLSVEPTTVLTSEEPVIVKFRIEKVSRRKDGKKFKVLFDISTDKNSRYEGIRFQPVLTDPVVVLSKRKLSISSTSAPPKASSKKRAKSKDSSADQATVEMIRNAVRKLEGQVLKLHQRVGVLERENKFLRNTYADDCRLEEFEPIPFNVNEPTRSVPKPIYQKLGTPTFFDNDYGVYDPTEEFDTKPITRGRKQGDGLNLDFGFKSEEPLFSPEN